MINKKREHAVTELKLAKTLGLLEELRKELALTDDPECNCIYCRTARFLDKEKK